MQGIDKLIKAGQSLIAAFGKKTAPQPEKVSYVSLPLANVAHWVAPLIDPGKSRDDPAAVSTAFHAASLWIADAYKNYRTDRERGGFYFAGKAWFDHMAVRLAETPADSFTVEIPLKDLQMTAYAFFIVMESADILEHRGGVLSYARDQGLHFTFSGIEMQANIQAIPPKLREIGKSLNALKRHYPSPPEDQRSLGIYAGVFHLIGDGLPGAPAPASPKNTLY